MITLTFDTETAVRAALPHLKAHLRRVELEPAIPDEELIARLTKALVPVVIHPPVPGSDLARVPTREP